MPAARRGKKAKKRFVNASGKRKTAIARAVAGPGKGRVRINSIPAPVWQPALARTMIGEPIKLAGDKMNDIDINIQVTGGGIMGQATAIRTALARSIIEWHEDEELKELFMKFDRTLLVNDPRRSEPKHPLGRKARKKRQKSYR